jgi:hypothetical protein
MPAALSCDGIIQGRKSLGVSNAQKEDKIEVQASTIQKGLEHPTLFECRLPVSESVGGFTSSIIPQLFERLTSSLIQALYQQTA